MSGGNEKLPTSFGKVLSEVRLRAGLSQQSLALECELDRTYISLLERGLRQPSLFTLFRLAETLSLTPSRLVRLTEQRYSGE